MNVEGLKAMSDGFNAQIDHLSKLLDALERPADVTPKVSSQEALYNLAKNLTQPSPDDLAVFIRLKSDEYREMLPSEQVEYGDRPGYLASAIREKFILTPVGDGFHFRIRNYEKEIARLERELAAWKETAAHFNRDTEYYLGLVVQIGKMLGHEAFVSDDGGVCDSVLCAKS